MRIRSKKGLVLLLITGLLAVSLTLVGCSDEEETNGEVTLSGTISEAGSTSCLPLIEELALDFMELHSGVTINYTGGGSSAGVAQCIAGTVDLGAASRNVKITEADVISYPIARDAVAVVLNSANTAITDLDLDEVHDIFSGTITDWGDVGGTAGQTINVYAREDGSGTRDCFDHGADIDDYVSTAVLKNSNGELQTAVQGDANGIGYVSLGYISGLNAVTVDGIEATIANCQSGDYPILRRLFVLTLGAPNELEAAFIDYARSETGQATAEDLGFVPLVLD